MDALSKEYLLDFYDKNLLIHGERPEALRWTPRGQRARYALMLEIAPSIEGSRVLDYGCGMGGLCGFMKERGIGADYTGADINPRLIGIARRHHPGASFHVYDAEEDRSVGPPGGPFDYTFVCGVFNNRVEGAGDSMLGVIAHLFKHTRVALGISAISSQSRDMDMDVRHTDPAELLGFALAYLSPFVTIRHDRVPGDVTMFVYKTPTKGPERHG